MTIAQSKRMVKPLSTWVLKMTASPQWPLNEHKERITWNTC